MRAYTHGGWAHRQWVSTTFWLGEKTHKLFLFSWQSSNIGSSDLESDALPLEPPRHPDMMQRTECSFIIIFPEKKHVFSASEAASDQVPLETSSFASSRYLDMNHRQLGVRGIHRHEPARLPDPLLALLSCLLDIKHTSRSTVWCGDVCII